MAQSAGIPGDFAPVFAELRAELKKVLEARAGRLTVAADTATSYRLLTKSPSPFPQHKGHPLYFAEVRLGKAYVSFHLMPLYMCPELASEISPALKKRMQGKTCFNFKTMPEPRLLEDLSRLTDASIRFWDQKHWL